MYKNLSQRKMQEGGKAQKFFSKKNFWQKYFWKKIWVQKVDRDFGKSFMNF